MRFFLLGCVLAVAGALSGCGGKAAPPATATPTIATATATSTATAATPKLTSAEDLAACANLERTVQAVSLVVGHTTEGITNALHPKDLAKKIGTAQQSLLDSAKVVELVHAPVALIGSQQSFVKGLRMFAADFERAKATTAKGNMAKATQQLTDEVALRKIQTSAKRIDDLCGA
jgi:hypothetical protein